MSASTFWTDAFSFATFDKVELYQGSQLIDCKTKCVECNGMHTALICPETEKKTKNQMTAEQNEFGQTAFLQACWHGQVDDAETMITNDKKVLQDRDSKKNQTALHIVCIRLTEKFYDFSHHRFWRLLKILLRNDIDVDAQDKFGWTALQYFVMTSVPTQYLIYEIELILQKKPNLLLLDNHQRAIAHDFPMFQKYFAYSDKLGRYVIFDEKTTLKKK